MSKKDLQNWLLKNKGFQKQYRVLLIESVVNQFPNIKTNTDKEGSGYDLNYLLTCASFLAQSYSAPCQDCALRIAQHCLHLKESSQPQKDASAVIFDTLANRPAISLAEKRGLLDKNYRERLPFALLQDWTRRSLENSITLSTSAPLPVNRFQKSFWDNSKSSDWISVSAPTTAGKSFIVGQWLADYVRKNPRSFIVYIVPTRALIEQVQQDIESLFQDESIKDVSITTLPLSSYVERNKSNVFIFTQERFHILLGEGSNNLKFDLLIVDEAQKVGDGHRGVLLQLAIEQAVNTNPNCRVFFASPMTENPSLLLDDAPDNISTSPVISEDIVVNQNLIWISQVPNLPKKWNMELILEKEPVQIGIFDIESSPSAVSKRLTFTAYSLGNSAGGNVIYVNGASDAEKAAKQLYDLIGDKIDISQDKDILELIDLSKKIIHKKYFLRYVLNRGIAFHYGNMPLLVRSEIERLFRINKIKYLICTSTLIEGINMPCQSIFVRGPTKGRGNPMSHGDFWNLAGRAGRWGKEFQGNVICVDAKKENVWKQGAPTERAKYQISRTSDEVLRKSSEIISYIDNDTPKEVSISEPKLEYVFSYLVSSYIRNKKLSNTKWAQRFPHDLIKTLDEKLSYKINNLSVPDNIILRNPGISPLAMDDLLKYFDNRYSERGLDPEELVPPPPESDNAVNEYTRILLRVNKCFGKVFGWTNSRVWQLALLIVNWMQGYPLAKIIASREQYYKNNNSNYKLDSLIRNTMTDVESFARFQAPKYLACYVDILRFHLSQIDRSDLIERLLNINILLEFGVSQTTQLSLMGLGLSRSSAIGISELITSDSLNEQECRHWLLTNNWMTEEMPEIVKREISSMLVKKDII